MNQWSLATLTSLVTVSSALAEDGKFDFRCTEVQAMIEMLQRGPDFVVTEAAQDPQGYVHDTISGWTCLMTPQPPIRNGRVILEALDCYADNGAKALNESAFMTAGEIFKHNLAEYYDCFDKELLTEAPLSYSNNSRGEGIVGRLKKTYAGRHIIVTYGYVWDSSKTKRIVWQTVVGYSAQ